MTSRPYGRHAASRSRPQFQTDLLLLVIVACLAGLAYLVVSRIDGSSTAAQHPLVNIGNIGPAGSAAHGSRRSSSELATSRTATATASTSSSGRLPSSAVVGVPPARSLGEQQATSAPSRIQIPSIGVDSALQPLSLLPGGTLQAPTQWQEAGWFAKGVRPGAVGPAVIAGHIDSTNGPAVFFRLRDLRPGDQVVVHQQNGHVLRFVVDTVRSYPKAHFPTDTVYGPTSLPELRLITCTGDFDRTRASYVDNLVVSARLLSAS